MSGTGAERFDGSALDPARSVVVEACAGSGKTWLLVSRVLRLLLAGVEPGAILAITFTRQAAQEMADRLHQWLRLLAVGDEPVVRAFLASRAVAPDQIDAALERGRTLYEQTLTAQPPLTISTFHSWFLQLLRSAPLEAAALGDVTLVERTSALLAQAWTAFGEACRRDPGSAPAQALDWLFERYGLQQTRRLLDRFVIHRADWWAFAGHGAEAVGRALARQSACLRHPPGTDPVAALFAEAGFVAEVRELCGYFARNVQHEQACAGPLAAALDGAQHEEAFAQLCRGLLREDKQRRVKKPSASQAGRLSAAGEQRYLELCDRLATRMLETREDIADQASYRANQAALAAGSALLAHYQRVKQERRLVDFADVEWLAYDLLCRADHAVTMHFKLDSRYRHILLDEFQDTNPQQWLALQAWFAAAAQVDSTPGVFLVGDPKQAIFRFRRADSRLFDAARDWLRESHGALLQTRDESRRCARSILDVVNRLFQAEAGFRPFAPHSAHDPAQPGRVEVLPLARNPAPQPDAADPGLRDPLACPQAVEEDMRREREAAMLVERLAAIVGHWHIREPNDPAAMRPVRYGDVMILVRRRTYLQIYERALRHAGMPFFTSRQGGLLETLEAADLMALLEFLVAPFADLELAHALRSPVFGCSDDDLAAIAQAGSGAWWERLARMPAAALGPRLERARALLARWLEHADRLPVHDTLDRIYFEGDVMRRYAAAVPEAMRTAVGANLNAFIQRALELDAGRYPSLPRFLAELRDMLAAPAEEAPDEGEVASGADAIRIMTVHGAKGLEAPLVWLLDAAAARLPDRGFDVLTQWEPGEPGPAGFSFVTRSRERSRVQKRQLETETRHAEREELNLLYVAMTRARQALIVSGCEGRGGAASWYARVRAAVAAAAGIADGPDSPLCHGESLAGSDPPQPVPPQDYAGATATQELAPAPVGRRREALATRGQRHGIEFHRVMQQATGGRCSEASQAAQQLGLPLAAVAPMWAQARALMADAELARFFDPKCYDRALDEWPLMTEAGELRRVDRLVELGAEVWVLDYKTGSLAQVAGTALEAEYRTQVERYCIALGPVFPGRRIRGLLLFADGSRSMIDPAGSPTDGGGHGDSPVSRVAR